jgi:ABC-2 type transport system ATP-binding protein
VIEARGLTKRYGPVSAVEGLTFDVRPGRVTGFLGPNGAGKPNLGLRHFFVDNVLLKGVRFRPAPTGAERRRAARPTFA